MSAADDDADDDGDAGGDEADGQGDAAGVDHAAEDVCAVAVGAHPVVAGGVLEGGVLAVEQAVGGGEANRHVDGGLDLPGLPGVAIGLVAGDVAGGTKV